MRALDRIGHKYNQLLIVSISHKVDSKLFVNTICDCGTEKVICLDNIVRTSHPTMSCGHLYLENRNSFTNVEPNYVAEFNRWHKRDVVGRDIECSLTLDNWIELVSEPCFYCNQDPNQVMHNSYLFMKNGIDRQNNEIGYHMDNSVSCCSICNYAKRSMPAEAFISWILRAAEHLNSGNNHTYKYGKGV